jgi:hypothetical protein
MTSSSHTDLYRQLIVLLRNTEGWDYETRHRSAEWFFRVNRLPLPEDRFLLDPSWQPEQNQPPASTRR